MDGEVVGDASPAGSSSRSAAAVEGTHNRRRAAAAAADPQQQHNTTTDEAAGLGVRWVAGLRGQSVWTWVLAHALLFVVPRPHWLHLAPAPAHLFSLRPVMARAIRIKMNLLK